MSEVTSKHIYLNRRDFMRAYALSGLLPSAAFGLTLPNNVEPGITDKSHALHYNNYYEFSTNKKAVAHLASKLTLQPWNIEVVDVDGRSQFFSINDLKQFQNHRRIYRLRCVEGWSMTVPWTGIALGDFLHATCSKTNAQFVRFESPFRPEEMISQRRDNFPWPYTEGLRMDEALHPLTMLAFGMYDEELAPQSGAPLRLVVPWKYGFKSLKALTRIVLTHEQPISSWSEISPGEYGFYANVNPAVPHPRWSQRRELPLGQLKKIATQSFNGYETEVAHLYAGMDLSLHY